MFGSWNWDLKHVSFCKSEANYLLKYHMWSWGRVQAAVATWLSNMLMPLIEKSIFNSTFIPSACLIIDSQASPLQFVRLKNIVRGFFLKFNIISLCVFVDFPDHKTRNKHEPLEAPAKFWCFLVEKIPARSVTLKASESTFRWRQNLDLVPVDISHCCFTEL